MEPAVPPDSYASLPTPVARLVELASKVEAPLKRHDYLRAAWEASLAMSAIAAGACDVATLAAPSMGEWLRHAAIPRSYHDRPELIAFARFLAHTLGKQFKQKSRYSAREILDRLPEYRNEASTAHAPPRSDDFYEVAVLHLAAGLSAAWQESFFWPAGTKLVYVSAIRLSEDGGAHARLFLLHGVRSTILAERQGVPANTLPNRVYLRAPDGSLRSLHPWVLFKTDGVEERAFLFHSSRNGLKYTSDAGATTSREELLRIGLVVEDPGAKPEVRSTKSTSAPTERRRAAWRLSRFTPPGPLLGVMGALAATILYLGQRDGLGLWHWANEGRLTASDWAVACAHYLDTGKPRAAMIACRNGLTRAGSPALKIRLSLLESRALSATGDPAPAQHLRAKLNYAPALVGKALEEWCTTPQSSGRPKLALPEAPQQSSVIALFPEPDKNSRPTSSIASGSCVWVVGQRALIEAGAPTGWYEVKVRSGDGVLQGWLPEDEIAPPDDSRTWLALCENYLGGGMFTRALAACSRGLAVVKRELDVARSNNGAGAIELESTRGRLAHALSKCEHSLGRPRDALDHLLEAYSASPSAALAIEIDRACAEQGQPVRPPGDSRRYRAVVWKDEDGGALRASPTREEQNVVSNLKRPTCVLTGGQSEVVHSSGQHETWHSVEALIDGKPTHGWMHQRVLAPY